MVNKMLIALIYISIHSIHEINAYPQQKCDNKTNGGLAITE